MAEDVNEQFLENIGLTKGEVKVYLALLQIGATTTGKIIEKTGLQKSTIYFCLDQLIAKGLVAHITKNNRKVFEAGSPDRLLDYLKAKEQKIQEQTKKVEEIIPLLYAKTDSTEKRESAKIFEGWNGMRSAFDSLLKGRDSRDYLIFSVSPLSDVSQRFRRFIAKMHQKRVLQNITTRVLVNEEFKDTIGKDRKKEKLSKVRFIPKEFSTPAVINVYADRVLIALWDEVPTAFVLENEKLANSFRAYFDMLWNTAKEK
jgi:sugar-specific transcriptional regulator TrmB